MNNAVARIKAVPTLALVLYGLPILLFLLGLWTGDRPVMAVAALGLALASLAWWVSS